MKKKLILIAVLASSLPAIAEPISDGTKCAVVGETMDAASPDLQKVREIMDYVLQTMKSVDRAYGIRGKVEILPRMETKGVDTLIAMVTVRCRDRQGVTIKSVAVETYEGMRAAQKGFGIAD
jgi:hypothetical protein